MLEHEHLKYRIERLESIYMNRNATVSEPTEEKVLKENLSKLFEKQQEMLNTIQAVLGRQNYNDITVTRNSKQNEIDLEATSQSSKCSINSKQTISEKEDITVNSVGGVTSDLHAESEPQSSIIIIEDDTHVHEKDGCRTEGLGFISQSDEERPISNSEANMERALHVHPNVLEGAPIQYRATTVPQPFLYTTWPQQVPPWMGQQPRMMRFPANNQKTTAQCGPSQQGWTNQRRTLN